ncbi:hypothetical protein EAI_14159 [Harpegnathos saltator]|uniref:Uncharacterized protein n=1 Tax=Harpegnathos saltator TaxID=610380 RepID=E2BUS6_HARSA|nr:hypothetical protein EAI_14159 [Harpegnathos saltator]
MAGIFKSGIARRSDCLVAFMDVKACTNLGDRILNITENLLGLSSGIPVIGRMMHN